jgi:hypothetical protein
MMMMDGAPVAHFVCGSNASQVPKLLFILRLPRVG